MPERSKSSKPVNGLPVLRREPVGVPKVSVDQAAGPLPSKETRQVRLPSFRSASLSLGKAGPGQTY